MEYVVMSRVDQSFGELYQAVKNVTWNTEISDKDKVSLINWLTYMYKEHTTSILDIKMESHPSGTYPDHINNFVIELYVPVWITKEDELGGEINDGFKIYRKTIQTQIFETEETKIETEVNMKKSELHDEDTDTVSVDKPFPNNPPKTNGVEELKNDIKNIFANPQMKPHDTSNAKKCSKGRRINRHKNKTNHPKVNNPEPLP